MRNWITGEGPESDIVLNSKIGLARNLKETPFPWLLSVEQNAQLGRRIEETLREVFPDMLHISMESLTELEKQALIERHILRSDMPKSTFGGLLLSPQGEKAILINEEDHIRIQVIYSGFFAMEAYEEAMKLHTGIRQVLNIAYERKWGYETCSLTNVGTGLKASLMLHLPGLVRTGNMYRLEERLEKMGMEIHGLYGEGSEAWGDLFHISNQRTFGKSAEELLDEFQLICSQILMKEREHRSYLLQTNQDEVEDRIYRAYGILKNARMLDYKEFLKLLSEVRMGKSMGVLSGILRGNLTELMIDGQPGNLQKKSGRVMDIRERDIYRAELVRERI